MACSRTNIDQPLSFAGREGRRKFRDDLLFEPSPEYAFTRYLCSRA
jgi:hypothetical protein